MRLRYENQLKVCISLNPLITKLCPDVVTVLHKAQRGDAHGSQFDSLTKIREYNYKNAVEIEIALASIIITQLEYRSRAHGQWLKGNDNYYAVSHSQLSQIQRKHNFNVKIYDGNGPSQGD